MYVRWQAMRPRSSLVDGRAAKRKKGTSEEQAKQIVGDRGGRVSGKDGGGVG